MEIAWQDIPMMWEEEIDKLSVCSSPMFVHTWIS
jgi:hypothetical protein